MDRTERFLQDRPAAQRPGRGARQRLPGRPRHLARHLQARPRIHARAGSTRPSSGTAKAGGYRYGQPDALAPSFALPGLWFNPGEVHALLTMQHLLSNLEPGLLAGHIKPLQARLKALLESRDHSAEEVENRFRIVHAARRQVATTYFEVIASATLSRKRPQDPPLQPPDRGRVGARRFPPCSWSTTATTGMWTPGATCAKVSAASPSTPSATPKWWKER